eukprot:gene31-12844_t
MLLSRQVIGSSSVGSSRTLVCGRVHGTVGAAIPRGSTHARAHATSRSVAVKATEPGRRAPPPMGTVGRKVEGSGALEFDPAQYVFYGGAIALQVGIMTATLWVLQQLSDALASGTLSAPDLAGSLSVPFLEGDDAAKGVVVLYWLVVSIKSRVFSPLDATRPNLKDEKNAQNETPRPDWMPPPITFPRASLHPPLTFPIVWTSIGLLRAAASVMVVHGGGTVWEACGRDLISTPLIIMCLHLAIGDAWNNVNVTRQELGMAVPGVFLGCLGSGIFVTAAYYLADPAAGQLLSPSVIWLTVASALVYSIWDLNTDADGNRMAVLPTKKA